MQRTHQLSQPNCTGHFVRAIRVRALMQIMSTLVLLLSSIFVASSFAQSTETVFTPASIPLTAAEIGNPGRGLHRWSGQVYAPAPMHDMYRRRHWSEIETSTGIYNLAKYDLDVRYAEQHGMRVILGLPQPTGPSANGGSWVPADLTNDKLGVWNRGSYHPNFNEPTVLNRWRALIDAIAQRYANDERVSGIQLSVVGAYGEWYFDPSVPTWAIPSDTTAQAMIDYIIAKFPAKQLYMLISPTMPQATIYALQHSPRIGWSRMALGDPGFDRTFQSYFVKNAAWWDLVSNRWKTAPVLTENYCTGDPNQFSMILEQVKRYHVSLVSNGNFAAPLASTVSPPPNWTAQQISDFQLAGKLSGYRYTLQSLRLSPLVPGRTFTATSAWTNVGVAPIYEPWRIHFQLRDTANTVIFDSVSALDLRTVLPTVGTAAIQADRFALPTSITPGSYHVHIVIPPFNKYVPPLQLATAGQGNDGSYYLGDVAVATSSSVPTATPSPTLTSSPVPTATPSTTLTSSPVPTATPSPMSTPTPSTMPTLQPGTDQQTIAFTAEADARVASAHLDKNYGRSSKLRVDASENETRSYLRFTLHDLPGTLISATLRIYARSRSADGPAVYGTTNDWSEKTLTWHNQPQRNTDVIDDAGKIAKRSWVTYNLTRLVQGDGTLNLVLVGNSANGVNFASRETRYQPQLLVTVRKP